MGVGMRCFFGFSLAGNSFSQQLEQRQGAELQRRQRQARHDFDSGVEALHDAIDAALAGGDAAAVVDRGLALLASCNDHLTAAAEALVQARAELFERGGVEPGDPLLAREPLFAKLDYDVAYRELAAHGAALQQQVLWQELVERLRDGGGRAGLRLLDRRYRELQSDLRALIAEVIAARRLSGPTFAVALHGNTRAVAAVEIGFITITVTGTYLAVLCERASRLQEHLVAAPALAVAG